MANDPLHIAKKAKNDEFYTRYEDIQTEINAYLEYNVDVFKGKTILCPCDDPEWSNFTKFFSQNFEMLGLKKLISTSFAYNSKQMSFIEDATDFEKNSPIYDENKTKTNGKIFVLEKDTNNNGRIDIEDLQWSYLEGDGDFRSKELEKLRDEADIIITNPPFSLFREFIKWIIDGGKKFIIIGNKNAITYKEVFPLIKDNKMWVGSTPMSKDLLFELPKAFQNALLENGKLGSSYRIVDGKVLGRSQSIWFASLEHGRRHQPLQLMTMEDNLKYSKHKKIIEDGYLKYDNYNAIDVPFTDAIPSDYEGCMGVPISFLDKYNPEQFEILGCSYSYGDPGIPYHNPDDSYNVSVRGNNVFKRIFIRRKKL